MFGPIGKTAKAFLEKRGFEIYRPTDDEKEFMTSFWGEWLSKRPEEFGQVYARNRETLRRYPSWISEEVLDASLWRYGVPDMWNTRERGLGETGLNEIEPEVTYSDLIGTMAQSLVDLRYLEIGVSVGKNFRQIAELFPNAALFALDVEAPNPIMAPSYETTYRSANASEVETLSGEAAVIHLSHHKIGRNSTYIQGDQFDARTWESMKGNKFNLVFSDGVHSARAVRDELEHLLANDLIASEHFIMYWDDLVDWPMQAAFRDNTDRLAELFGTSRRGLHRIHGTYGARRINGWFEGRR